jgi:16S rRNA (uracil1498-N3)-methyltransferase
VTLRVFASEPKADPCPPLHAGAPLSLGPSESHYLWRVRRARPGRALEVLDGHGGVWTATLSSGSARACVLELGTQLAVPTPPRSLTLLLGLPEAAATLDAIALTCALGVHEIVMVRCTRSPSEVPGPARRDRVLRAVLRQCGRPSPPRITGPCSLNDALAAPRTGAGFFAWTALRTQGRPSDTPRAQRRPSDTPQVPPLGPRAWLAIGPEGGFTDEEAETLRAHEATALALGPWILRTENAAEAGLTRLMFAPPLPT